MEAMIFAAGLGTRMAPLTDTMPKALIPVRGRPLIGHVMDRLIAAGVTRLIVNTAHFGSQVAEWLEKNVPRGVEIEVSPEPGGPYDTGGGLLAAARHFRGDGPVILHNVDILSKIPLDVMLDAHRRKKGIATVAVQDRETSRKLIFDDVGLLGWRRKGDEKVVRDAKGPVKAFGFSGIHVIEHELLGLITRTGTFSILDVYLDLAAKGRVTGLFDATSYPWLDVGTPERLAAAERF